MPKFVSRSVPRTKLTEQGLKGLSAREGRRTEFFASVYDRHSDDREKKEALDGWERRLDEILRRHSQG